MKVAYFTHSLASCWNHGNAHFLRGVLRELVHAGHEVEVFEPEISWSRENLIAERGAAQADAWKRFYPELKSLGISADFGLEDRLFSLYIDHGDRLIAPVAVQQQARP